MAEKFVLNTDESVVFKKLSTWIKGTMNNQNGTIHVTNQRLVFCARNRWKTLLGGALLDMKGNLVGITTSGFRGTQLNFAIASEEYKEL